MMYDIPEEEIYFDGIPEHSIHTCFYYEFIRELVRENRINTVCECSETANNPSEFIDFIDNCSKNKKCRSSITRAYWKLKLVPGFPDKPFVEILKSDLPENMVFNLNNTSTFLPPTLNINETLDYREWEGDSFRNAGDGGKRIYMNFNENGGSSCEGLISFDWRYSDKELLNQFEDFLKILRPEKYMTNTKPASKDARGENLGLFKKTALKYLSMYRIEKFAEGKHIVKADIRAFYSSFARDESDWRKAIREVKSIFDKLILGDILAGEFTFS